MQVCEKRVVLILDRGYYPHRIAPWKRAMKLLYGANDKAEVISLYNDANTQFDVAVVRLLHRSLPPQFGKKRIKFSKRYLFMRDNYSCQYCGSIDVATLTIDHIIPKSRGGANSYQNCIASCLSCNNKKGNMTPEEAGMKLLEIPAIPSFGYLVNPHTAPDEWKQFL